MSRITLQTWSGSGSLSLEGSSLYLDYAGKKSVIPLSQVIAFEVKDPKSKLRPGMVTIKLGGASDTHVRLTSFLSIGGSNNIEFPHGYDYLEAAHEMQRQVADYLNSPPQDAANTTSSVSVADELRQLKSLLDDGIITDEEFAAKKKQLLGL